MVSPVRRRTDDTTFEALPPVAQGYVVAVTVLGAASLALSVAAFRTESWLVFAALLALTVLTSAMKIELPLGRGQSNLSFGHAVIFWSLITMGSAPTVCIAAVSALAQTTLRASAANPPHRVLFSIASLALAVWVTAVPLDLAIADASRTSPTSLLLAVAVGAPLYFLINTLLVAGAVALSTRQGMARVWQRNFLWSAPSYLIGAALAAAAAAAWDRGLFVWLLGLVVPVYLVFRSYDSVVTRLREEQDDTRRAMDVQLATTEALALAIEAKAGCTPDHVRSIQRYAAMLAEAAGLSDAEVQAVRAAALLHDIGNMAVPEHILAKRDKLTPEEFERVKIHPRVGADVLREVPFGAPVADFVLSHHERWDGLGYPSGLRGDAIPLGARILSIADVFSTLQTARPYRTNVFTEAEAIATLRDLSGKAFDPALVELLVTRLHQPVAGASEAEHAAPEHTALIDISDAHREEQVLYEIAQALGSRLGVDEAMALIRDKVNRLVPFVTCALFLGDDEQGFTCGYAHGPGTEALLKWSPKTWSELSLRLPACADGRAGRGEDLVSVLPCRLTYDGKLIGAMAIYHTVPACFTDEHRRVLMRVSEQAAAVIDNSTRYEQTRHESQTDALTGLPNRRSFERQLAAGLLRALNAQASATLVALDLDRLKEINDTYGHEAGDKALRAIGSVLRSTIRETDLCARFGGDEFVMVLWDCDPAHEARRVADVQNAVAAFPFEPRLGVRTPLSISAGCARFPRDGVSLHELLAAADTQMYQDKASRRTRTASSVRKRSENGGERA